MGIAEHEAKCKQIEADVSKWGKLKPGRGITLTEGEAARLEAERGRRCVSMDKAKRQMLE